MAKPPLSQQHMHPQPQDDSKADFFQRLLRQGQPMGPNQAPPFTSPPPMPMNPRTNDPRRQSPAEMDALVHPRIDASPAPTFPISTIRPSLPSLRSPPSPTTAGTTVDTSTTRIFPTQQSLPVPWATVIAWRNSTTSGRFCAPSTRDDGVWRTTSWFWTWCV